MARLRITIEGEMSPEELKAYMAAAWSLKAQLPHDVALSTVDLDAEPAAPVAEEPAPVVEPEPVALPVVEPEQPEQAPQEETLVEQMGKCKTLAILIDRLEQKGLEWDAILRTCLQYQKEVPLLERQGASLEDRLCRTKEFML